MQVEIIEWLNKRFHCNLTTKYYKDKIGVWRKWWEGYYKPFHHYQISDGQKLVYRDRYLLDMGKKVCEDWASILLNDKTCIVVDNDAASVYLQGADQTGGVFGDNKFWDRANKLVEKAFWSGTGAVVLRLINLHLDSAGQPIPDKRCKVKLNYLDARCIVPLSFDDDEITEVAFCSEVSRMGKSYLYLEMHTLDNNGHYVVENQYFTLEYGVLKEAPLPDGMAASWHTHSDVPMFAIVKPNIENNLDPDEYPECGLGISILENAIDCLKGVDLAYNNLCCDFKLGGKKVFMSDKLLQKDSDGRITTPDDAGQQLFMWVKQGTSIGGDGSNQLIAEHNPTIRVTENTDGIQAQLDYLSFKVGFGTKHYQFNNATQVTATQYAGDRQDLIQNANKHYISVEAFLQQLVRAILWAGKNCIDSSIKEDAGVSVQFDDSIIIDKETERARDKEDVRDGIMAKWEFRQKWYGEDEETAKAAIQAIEDGAEPDDDELMGFDVRGAGDE